MSRRLGTNLLDVTRCSRSRVPGAYRTDTGENSTRRPDQHANLSTTVTPPARLWPAALSGPACSPAGLVSRVQPRADRPASRASGLRAFARDGTRVCRSTVAHTTEAGLECGHQLHEGRSAQSDRGQHVPEHLRLNRPPSDAKFWYRRMLEFRRRNDADGVLASLADMKREGILPDRDVCCVVLDVLSEPSVPASRPVELIRAWEMYSHVAEQCANGDHDFARECVVRGLSQFVRESVPKLAGLRRKKADRIAAGRGKVRPTVMPRFAQQEGQIVTLEAMMVKASFLATEHFREIQKPSIQAVLGALACAGRRGDKPAMDAILAKAKETAATKSEVVRPIEHSSLDPAV
ncbi:MAG: hypothetical protein BJ554DRAFT_4570 [Olpidium bornovanus]|uniref:Uncharacterized protein n=1 Tax=Olpidium bornovanus TaxID=278681 RepID=A0A8H7ZMK6_9FUNG|nr:MAG: hypothetical protein BJ554DRAFT_4570 [Olpidium bornovanus]